MERLLHRKAPDRQRRQRDNTLVLGPRQAALIVSSAYGNASGFPTTPFYPTVPLAMADASPHNDWCPNATGGACVVSGISNPGTIDDAVLNHLNLLTNTLRTALTIRINTTHEIVPIFAGTRTGRGTLDSALCPNPPRFNFSAPDMAFESSIKNCNSAVPDPAEVVGLYCAQDDHVFHLFSNTGAVLTAASCAGSLAGGSSMTVQWVGLCGVASVCIEPGRVSVHSLTGSGTVATPWANWTHSTLYTTLSVHIVPENLYDGACGSGVDVWRAFALVRHRSTGAYAVWRYNGASTTPTTVTSSTQTRPVFLFTATHDLFRNVLNGAATGAVTVLTYWTGTVVAGSGTYNSDELSLVYVQCTPPSENQPNHCVLTILRTTTGDPEVTTAVHTDVAMPIQIHHDTVMAHAHVHFTTPMVSSFAAGSTEGDVLVFARTDEQHRITIHTCYIKTGGASIYCADHDANVALEKPPPIRIRKFSQFIAVDAGPKHRWLFNAASFVRTNTTVPYGACWADPNHTPDTTTVNAQTHAIGGIFEYARQYVSWVPNTTSIVDIFGNTTNGNVVVVYNTVNGIEIYQLTGTSCYLGQATEQPPSSVALQLLFPGAPCVDISAISATPPSVYIGNDATVRCTAAQLADGSCTNIGITASLGTEYFDLVDDVFCAGATAPDIARGGAENPNADRMDLPPAVPQKSWLRNAFQARRTPGANPVRCLTVHTWATTGDATRRATRLHANAGALCGL